MKKQLLGAATAALLVGAIPNAQAVATLGFQLDSSSVIFCADQTTCDDNPILGAVSYNDTIGGVVIHVTTGFTKPIVNGNPLIDLNSISVVAQGAHELRIAFSETDFTAQGRFSGAFGGTLNGADATVSAQSFYDAGNNLFTAGAAMELLGPFSGPSFNGTLLDGAAPSGPYSVSLLLVLNTSASQDTTFSGDFAVNVPEPTTLALLGLGLLAFGFGSRRQAV